MDLLREAFGLYIKAERMVKKNGFLATVLSETPKGVTQLRDQTDYVGYTIVLDEDGVSVEEGEELAPGFDFDTIVYHKHNKLMWLDNHNAFLYTNKKYYLFLIRHSV